MAGRCISNCMGELRYNRSKLLKFSAVCVGFSLFFIISGLWISRWVVVDRDYDGVGAAFLRVIGPNGILVAVSGLALILIGLAVVYAARGLSRAPVLVWNGEGVRFRGLLGVRHIAWSEILEIHWHMNGQMLWIASKSAAGRRREQGIWVPHLASYNSDIGKFLLAAQVSAVLLGGKVDIRGLEADGQ
jgi:hypothetical protein